VGLTVLVGFGFAVLSTTNLPLPITLWTVPGRAIETPPRFYEFLDQTPTNSPQQFYRLRYS